MTDIACRVCGQQTDLNVEVRLGRTPFGQRDPSGDITLGTCPECMTLDTVTPGLAVRACLRLLGKPEADWPALAKVLADMEIDAAEVLFEVTGHPRRGPQRKPFRHVDRATKSLLNRAYANLLAARVEATLPQPEPEPTPPPTDALQGCLSCGVALALNWHGPLRSFGLVRGPDPVTGYLCPACAGVLEQVGAVGEDFLERAAMQAKGLDWVPRVRAWVATGLPPQDQPWGWIDLQEPPLTLDPITFLQMRVADLTDDLAALRAEVAALRGVPVPT